MPRRVPLTLRDSVAKPAGGEQIICLVTIDGPDLDAPFRLASDWTEVISLEPYLQGVRRGGEVYTFGLMRLDLPDEAPGVPPSTELVLENVTSRMVEAVLTLTEPLDIELRLIYAGDTETNIDPYVLRCESASYDLGTVTLPIGRDDDGTEQASRPMNKDRLPGLFR